MIKKISEKNKWIITLYKKMKNYLEQIKQYLINDDFESLDALIEHLYFKISEKERNTISDIIDEATLYIELKEDNYKYVALKLIDNFNK